MTEDEADDILGREQRYVLRAHSQTDQALAVTAEWIADQIARAVEARGKARIALPGGSTPRKLFELLVSATWIERIPWEQVHVFYGDERCVPLDAPESNHRSAQLALLKHVPVPASQIHPVDTSLPPYDAAEAYAKTLGRAALDVVLLGIGEDGHCASLFPGGPEVTGLKSGSALCTKSPLPPTDRVTLSLESINAARAVAFLVLGAAKAPALNDVLLELDGPDEKITLPAAMVRPTSGPPQWFVDRDAAGGRQ
ncbi:MAG: 6-phosphogluconolactonase [Planctomycetota bacterium]